MTDFMIIDSQVPERALVALKKHNEGFMAWAGRTEIVIDNDDQQKNLEDLLILGRRAQKDVDAELKLYTDPIRAAEKQIRDLFRPYQNLLELVAGRMNQALTVWNQKKVRAQEEARLAALQAQAAQIAEAKETGEVIDWPKEQPAPVLKTSHTHMGTVSYRKDYDIQVVNPDLVPRDLCEPSLTKIRARVKSGVTDIPGCLISEKTVTAARAG